MPHVLIPGLVIQGNQDSIVSEETVSSLVERLSKQRGTRVSYQVIDGADHFIVQK
jgi:alpha/beta superfamily hydrolase